VERGALPIGVVGTPALTQAARQWMASRSAGDAQLFAQALLAATIAPPTPATSGHPAAAALQGAPAAGAVLRAVGGGDTALDLLGDGAGGAAGDREDDSSEGDRACLDCGQPLGQGPHTCQPQWLESYPDELRARARDFIRAMLGIVDLANGSKPLGSGPFAMTERKA